MYPITILLPLIGISVALSLPSYIGNTSLIEDDTTSAYPITGERSKSIHITPIHNRSLAPSMTTLTRTVDISVTNSHSTEALRVTATFTGSAQTATPTAMAKPFQRRRHAPEVGSQAGHLEQRYHKRGIHPHSQAHIRYRFQNLGRREKLRTQNATEHCGDLECDTPNAGIIVVHSAASSLRVSRLFLFTSNFGCLVKRAAGFDIRRIGELRTHSVLNETFAARITYAQSAGRTENGK